MLPIGRGAAERDGAPGVVEPSADQHVRRSGGKDGQRVIVHILEPGLGGRPPGERPVVD